MEMVLRIRVVPMAGLANGFVRHGRQLAACACNYPRHRPTPCRRCRGKPICVQVSVALRQAANPEEPLLRRPERAL